MTFYLLTDEYDAMEDWNPYEKQLRKLGARTFEEALIEARIVFENLNKYSNRLWDGTYDWYPKNPRVCTEAMIW